ncbi:alpha/beta hydrolase [Naasia lichenicola]|uniref:Alpha/beta hydrolase n=1 Tax=Naasia lichenicola TaxID=2565933 RepID=A0A4S4FQK5_9MICO|nr:alpha/beta hydrolase [Naasia lichenicola]THG32849.1 alpha/beta hydrolase [Naasia lichenicola]
MTTAATPVIFIHGLWVHGSAWADWMARFEVAGYLPVAPGWPGDAETVGATRAHPEAVANVSVQQATDHFARIAREFSVPPIVVGHSFGGLIAQKLLEAGVVSAAVAIDPSGIKGVKALPIAQIRAVFPIISKKSNRTKGIALTRRQFRFAFGNKIARQEADSLFDKWSVPSTALPVFETASQKKDANSGTKINTAKQDRGPLLITGGQFDHTVPEVVTRQSYELYTGSAKTDYHRFDNRGHSLTMDHGWTEVADYVLGWLGRQSLGTVTGGATTRAEKI